MTTDVKKPEETKVTQLAPNRIHGAEATRNVWCVTPEADTPPEALLDPRYWSHYSLAHGVRISIMDRLECFSEDGSWFVELMVRNVFRGGINVVELRRVKFDGTNDHTAENLGDFLVKWSGPILKFTVERKSDKRRMSDGHISREKALEWLRDAQRSWAA